MARAPDENVNRWLQPHRLSFDFGRKKAVVVDPLNCMVGCNTCANAYSTHAIEFPPLDTVFELEGEPEVRHAVEDELIARRAELAFSSELPHSDRLVELRVDDISGHRLGRRRP